MTDTDPVERFLRERGCPQEVVSAGLDGLVAEWERVVSEVENGYRLGLDDYLNDLDGRQLLDEVLAIAPLERRRAVAGRVEAADERMKRRVRRTPECLWGRRVADSEGWTPDDNWWYFNLPRAPGPLLREDLEQE